MDTATRIATPEDDDGLKALTHFVRQAAGADYIVAFEAGEDGVAEPLAATPGPLPRHFALGSSRLGTADWSNGPLPASRLRLPSAVLAAMDRPAQQALFMPAPTPEAPRSGVLMLFASNAAWQCDCPFRTGMGAQVPLLGKVFGQMLAARSAVMQRRQLSERFHDLFESVSSGIVVLEGDGDTALVNESAAAMLGVSAGEIDAGRLAGAMRRLRESTHNAAALAETYGPLQGDVNYALITYWLVGDRQYEVDTHPVLGDGQKGRIWLFNDVTAQRQAQEELRRLAGTDPLTNLPNRRNFNVTGQALIERMRLEGRPMAVLMLDIDHFKSINDRYGHPAGDKVLQAVAFRCRGLMRDHDMIARLGGEEFAVLLPYAGEHEAEAIAERLRAAVAAAPVVADGEVVVVQMSIGGTLQRAEDATLDAILARADEGLYRAKREGRNRVVFAA